VTKATRGAAEDGGDDLVFVPVQADHAGYWLFRLGTIRNCPDAGYMLLKKREDSLDERHEKECED